MSFRKTMLVNIGSNWAYMFVATVVQLVMVPVITLHVGIKGYGVWALLSYGLNYPMIFESAFGLAMNRFVAHYQDDKNRLVELISASFVILGICSFLTIIVFWGLSFFVTDMFNAITAEYAQDARIVCVLVGFTMAFSILSAVFSGTLKGALYYTRCNMVNISACILRLILAIIFLLRWKSIVAVQFAFLVSMIFATALLYYVAKVSIVNFDISFKLITWKSTKELLIYSMNSIVRSGSRMLMESVLLMVVGWKGTASDAALYNIAFRLPSFIRGIMAGAQNVFLPAVSGLYAKRDWTSIGVVIRKGTRMCAVLTFSSLGLLFFLAEDILRIWLHGQAPSGTVQLMRLMVIAMLPGGIFELWLPVFVAMGKLKWMTVTAISMAIMAVGIELVLLHTHIVSVPEAAAWALLVVLWLRNSLWIPMYGIKVMKMTFLDYFSQSLKAAIGASVLMMAALLGLRFLFQGHESFWILKMVLSCFITGIIFTAFALRQETVQFIDRLRQYTTGN